MYIIRDPQSLRHLLTLQHKASSGDRQICLIRDTETGQRAIWR